MKFWKAVKAVGKACFEYLFDMLASGLVRAAINTIVCLVLMIISFLLGAWFF